MMLADLYVDKKNPNIREEVRANRDSTGKLVNVHILVRAG